MFTEEGFQTIWKYLVYLFIAQVINVATQWIFDWPSWKWVIGFILFTYIFQYEKLKAKEKDVVSVTQVYRRPSK